MRLRHHLVFVAFALVCVATSASAQRAESDDERARMHFLAGTSYVEQRRFNEAAEQFYDAYRLSGRAALLLNAANAYELGREVERAAELLGLYLGHLPEDDPNRRTLEIRLEGLQDLVAQEREAQARGGLERVAAERASVGEGPGVGARLRISGFITLGAGAGFGLGALATGLMAESRYRTLAEHCDERVCEAELEADAASGRRLALTSTILTSASVAALVTGAILAIVGSKRQKDAHGGEAAWFIDQGPGELGLRAGWRF